MTGPFFQLVPLCAAIIGVCWLLSVITREYSWVDRIWSIAPPVYVWLMCWLDGWNSPRMVLMAVLATLWGARLTFNYARKGGYQRGGEDYRWAVLRKRLGPVKFQIFNATFIAPYQNALIFMLIFPANFAGTAPIGAPDLVLAALFLAFLIGETIADQQQWRFYEARKARGGKGEQFLTEGLFRFSRHPNFFCEVSQWWVFYGFAVVGTGEPLQWSILGTVLLTLLFDGSSRFTEQITLSKYPEYADYRKRTSRLIPWMPG